MNEINLDNLIIGSGPGGAVVADELTSNNMECAIVEEGENLSKEYDLIDNNISGIGEELQNKWRNGGAQFTIGKHPISFSEACCYGGGSEINSGIYQEVSDPLIKNWEKKYKIDNFNPEIIKSLYTNIKSKINLTVENRNSGSPSKIIQDVSKSENWSIKDLPRISKRSENNPNDSRKLIRQSMTSTLLKKAEKRNLKIFSKIKIIKLIKKNKKIIKAIGKDKNNILYQFSAKNFFVCCGALQTPLLLKKSGIVYNIGKYFRLHPTLRLIVRFDKDINANDYPLPLYAITEFLPNIRLSGANFSLPILSSLIAEDWNNRSHILKDWKKTIILYVMIKPDGFGKILSLPLLNEPLVFYKLLNNDYRNLSYGLQKYIKALFKIGAKEIIPCISNYKSINSDSNLEHLKYEYLKNSNLNLMSIHLFGSCIPGNNLDYCATDSFGKVYKYDNLFICDASQIPEAIGVNPQATVMAMSLRNIRNFFKNKN